MEKEVNNGKSHVVIATHSGRFHTDDVFAVATLCLVLEKNFADTIEIEIIRTRDMQKIESADFVVDAGFKYDSEKNRFDHHQPGGAGIRDNGIPYASFGLVWKKYGAELAGSSTIAYAVEKKLILPIDAPDNGVDITIPVNPEVVPYELRDMVTAFKPTWKEGEETLYANFLFMVGVAKEVIKREISFLKDIEESDSIIREIYVSIENKSLLIIDKNYDWKEVVSTIPDILLVVYPKLSDGTWGVQSGRDNLNSYKNRLDLPKSWAGKRDEELESVTGVQGSVFCHKDRFMAVAKTKESAIELAHLALKEAGK